ncbi:MAG TPA: UDP-N-acetylmuramoyl-L-alanyl-D-glutamate--2,6-diaminopimelate ligase [Phycisphaerales bacterium]|nr:UDP-N-acetylmuramoyl-L-alanyl-D-glutamate--2,6-diaminopimelate ligase [Phycisphaerales bacterium]HMP36585.1 UDP-N-acetylmuramoyl-L-alanyl-D-glutamate--2,6-diaminopimelate ligase [Phycisphaerales bacterium]
MRLDQLLAVVPEVRRADAGRAAADAPILRSAAEAASSGSEIRPDPRELPTEVSSVHEDSRLVGPGSLFVARRGTSADGASFLEDALRRGAAAILVEVRLALEARSQIGGRAALLVAEDAARAGARLAEAVAGFPSRALDLVGVTGTNGKTTIAFLVQQLLSFAGRRCGVIGTVLVDDGASTRSASLTTPAAPELSAILARMVGNGCSAAALECSSHALAQRRTAGLRFAAAIFTNLTGDHLDYHGSMEEYGAAKAGLFAGLDSDAVAVVNADASAAERMLRDCRARRIRCSLRTPEAEWFAHLDAIDPSGISARLHAPWGSSQIKVPLAGTHNLMNALEAAAAVHALGVPGEAIVEGLARVTAPPGRLERVEVPGGHFTVLVDYAHTDDALDNVLRALCAVRPAGARVIALFGCGGDRDRTKRPRMAAVAARLADQVVITSDNPRTERPEAIIDEILTGVPAEKRAIVRCEVDRARAIEEAIESAAEGDIVLIAGKGHEDYQIIGSARRPFDDRAAARAAIARRFERCGAAR